MVMGTVSWQAGMNLFVLLVFLVLHNRPYEQGKVRNFRLQVA